MTVFVGACGLVGPIGRVYFKSLSFNIASVGNLGNLK